MFYFLRSFKFLITKANNKFSNLIGYQIGTNKNNSKSKSKNLNILKNNIKKLSSQECNDFKKCLIFDSKFNDTFDDFLNSMNIRKDYIFFKTGTSKKLLNKGRITQNESELTSEINNIEINQFEIVVVNIINKITDENVYTFLKTLFNKINPTVKVYMNINFTNNLYPKPFPQRFMPPKVWNKTMGKSNNYTNTLLLEDYLNIIEDNNVKYRIKNKEYLENKFDQIKKNINPIYWCHLDEELYLSSCILECSLK
ncbi:MAG: hypothetical protein JJ831_08050 [Prochlorococcus marinus XMU1422]|nr:hypothetical protein [Prochlorococcus marinus XMU1421]MBO7013252.1 hypothetical protein [Prochlorococcus marinus XMU1422]MCR8542293.1 hypothetical protein [Prochlorococcus marinus XMU1423]